MIGRIAMRRECRWRTHQPGRAPLMDAERYVRGEAYPGTGRSVCPIKLQVAPNQPHLMDQALCVRELTGSVRWCLQASTTHSQRRPPPAAGPVCLAIVALLW